MRTGNWGKLVAFFDVKTEEGFIIKGFKLFNGINGLFVGMPSEKRQDENGEDKYYDTIWLTDEVRENMREQLNNMASEEYNKNNSSPQAVDTAPVDNDMMSSTPREKNDAVLQTEKNDAKVDGPPSVDDLPF